jgi:hypothetical protein
MRGSQVSKSPIVAIWQSVDHVERGVPVTGVMREHGISRATFLLWKAKYAGSPVAALKR